MGGSKMLVFRGCNHLFKESYAKRSHAKRQTKGQMLFISCRKLLGILAVTPQRLARLAMANQANDLDLKSPSQTERFLGFSFELRKKHLENQQFLSKAW